MNDYIIRLEAAYARRQQSKHGIGPRPAVCEACGTPIPLYRGPAEGILCLGCLEPNWALAFAGNLHSPLPQGEWNYRQWPG